MVTEPPAWNTTSVPAPKPSPYAVAAGKRYLLPTTLLHHGGLYEYVLVDVEQARRWLLAGPCTSFLGHPFLHEALERVIGFVTPPPQRGPLPVLDYHDDALCFVVEGYETLPDLKRGDSRRVRELVDAEHYTLGLLRRLA
jgi:hypothetical protein